MIMKSNAQHCVKEINITEGLIDKVISHWVFSADYILQVISAFSLQLRPVFSDCSNAMPEIVEVWNKLMGIFDDFNSFQNKWMSNMFGLIGIMGMEIQGAKNALAVGDFYHFGQDLGEMFYLVVLRYC